MPRTAIFGFLKSKTKGKSKSTLGIFPARVRYAMLEGVSQPQTFKKFGEYQSLGGVFFTLLNKPNPNPDFSNDSFALPLFPNVSNVPLENEIVYIMPLPSNNVQNNVNSTIYYYFQPINIWGSVHHNAIPDPFRSIFDNVPGANQTRDYISTEAGLVRRVTDGGTEIDLGDTFVEKLSIRNLLPYEGDNLFQGRWGNTIRLGSTVQDAPIPNPWSDVGFFGDPITIIKNGQHDEDTDPWVPQIEDINLDLSNLYLTSTQAIPITVASNSYNSYFNPPISPNKFDKPQIILSSGRLLFNSYNDSILLSSDDTINLNSNNSVNIDTPSTVIKSDKVLLGDKNARESVILGDLFLADFQSLMTTIITLSSALQTPIGTPIPFVPNVAIPVPAVQVQNAANKMLNKIQQYKSQISKTK